LIAFLTICYAGLVWLIFLKLKLLPWNRATQAIVATAGIVGVFMLIVLMGLYQPQAVQATVSQRVVPIVARVQGRVVAVPVEANVPVKKGDVLLELDPGPYEAEVNRLAAALAAAEQAVPQLKAAWDEAIAAREQTAAERDLASIDLGLVQKAFDRGAANDIELETARARLNSKEAALKRAVATETQARLAYESEIGGVNTTVAQTRAQLARAQIDLDECTVYAPADGIVTQHFVEPGAVTLTATFSSVMSFVYDEKPVIRAVFKNNALRHMKVGDTAEIVFATVPGKVFAGSVGDIVPATGSGALAPSGDLLTTAELESDLVLARIKVEDERFDRSMVPTGTAANVAVYTDGAKPIRIVRKVVLRIQAWLNYL
jgi:multidrug resistance efflux pump